MIFFAVLLTQSFAMEFTPYHSAEQYKCGAFLQRRIDDKTLSYFYSSINNFVSLLSTWWSWQKGWLIAVCSLISIGIVFPIFYLFYRCCVCCWSSPSRKQNTDSRYDGCKRNCLNVIMVFAAATLLITGQYAEYGMEELPSRLNYCIDDLNLYKRETDSRIRKLLIDDYQMLNRTLLIRLSDAGHEVIQRVKKLTGVEFGRMRNTLINELQLCLHNEIESVKAVCHKAEKSLEAMTPPRLKVDLVSTFLITILKRIADDLFVTAETISTQIRQVWNNQFRRALRFSCSLVTSIFMLIAFCFLFGLFYGVCGRRPTFYNDDCCVRSTGGRFYSWLLSFISFFLYIHLYSVTRNLVGYGHVHCTIHPYSLSLIYCWKCDLSVVDLIRGCQRNETLYEVFELDKKFQLKRLKSFESEAYMKLERFLNVTFTDLPAVEPFNFIISEEHFELLQQLSSVNVSEIDHIALSKINSTISNMDIEAKAKVFESKLDAASGRPKAVSSMLEQVDEIGTRRARPLRLKLNALFTNLTKLNKRLEKMQVPISSLIAKLQHSQALLSENLQENVEKAAREQLVGIFDNIDQYIDHVRFEMQHDVSSCAPIAAIVSSSASAVCDHTIDTLVSSYLAIVYFLKSKMGFQVNYEKTEYS
ncbi:unnamed protein product [Angiostrongylus costaricensis]|uniref:Prominin-like protein n=1 Tax=Angiostrongylus costaricensis TaxID=334426 RepID=A0A158PD90_ANGCS|nr:unnamed protein product [Angiostrongylus costaricensis]